MIQLLVRGAYPLTCGADGLTDDPVAVFGSSPSSAPLPAWIGSVAVVAERIDAKQHDDVPSAVWMRIGGLLRRVDRLPCGRPLDVRGWTQLTRALADARTVLAHLPQPGPRYFDLPVLPLPQRASWPTGPVRFLIDGVCARLVDLLTDPSWTDPVVLAGEVTDLLDALENYAANAHAWLRFVGAPGSDARSGAGDYRGASTPCL